MAGEFFCDKGYSTYFLDCVAAKKQIEQFFKSQVFLGGKTHISFAETGQNCALSPVGICLIQLQLFFIMRVDQYKLFHMRTFSLRCVGRGKFMIKLYSKSTHLSTLTKNSAPENRCGGVFVLFMLPNPSSNHIHQSAGDHPAGRGKQEGQRRQGSAARLFADGH